MPSAASPGPRPPLRAKHAVSAPEPANGPLSPAHRDGAGK